jgi:hypothetical protein
VHFLQFKTCRDHVGEIKVDDEGLAAYETFLAYSSYLLTGQDMNVAVPDAESDENIERLTLYKLHEIDINAPAVAVASVYLMCGDPHHKDEKENAASRLILPQGVSLTST